MILIIDDEIEQGALLVRFLRGAGLESVAISTGLEALTNILLHRPALIILDLHMPLLDGMAVLRSIRQEELFKNIPVLIYTAEFAKDKEIEAFHAGAQGFLVKGTIGLHDLLHRITELLEEQHFAPHETS